MDIIMINKKILCIIPARGGSKGVYRKNLRNLGNKPLIQWTIDEAKKSQFIDRIVVSTEDEEIKSVCTLLETEVIKRPVSLAGDDSSAIDALLYTLNLLEDTDKYYPEYLLQLQCTSPFRSVEDIDNAIKTLLLSEKDVHSLISVSKEESPPWWLKNINEDGILSDFISYDKQKYTRRQSFPSVYRLNGAIYLCEVTQFKKYKSFETDKTLAYIMNNDSSIDIDTEQDLKWANHIVANNIK